MNILMGVGVVATCLVVASTAWAGKKTKYRDVQKVDFTGESVEGKVRNPYGAYLVQKKTVKFLPLYKVREKFDERLKNSSHYLR